MAAFIQCAAQSVPADAVLSFTVSSSRGVRVSGAPTGDDNATDCDEVVLRHYNLQTPHCTIHWDADHNRGSLALSDATLHALCLVNGVIVKRVAQLAPGDRVNFGGGVVFRISALAKKAVGIQDTGDALGGEGPFDAWSDAVEELLRFRGDVVTLAALDAVTAQMEALRRRLADSSRVAAPLIVQSNAIMAAGGKPRQLVWRLDKARDTELAVGKNSVRITWSELGQHFVATSARNRVVLTHGAKLRLADAEFMFCDDGPGEVGTDSAATASRRSSTSKSAAVHGGGSSGKTMPTRHGAGAETDEERGDSGGVTTTLPPLPTEDDIRALADAVHHLQFTAQSLLQTLPADNNPAVAASLTELKDLSILERPTVTTARRQIEKAISGLQLYAHHPSHAAAVSRASSNANTTGTAAAAVAYLNDASPSAEFVAECFYALCGRCLTSPASSRDAQQSLEKVLADSSRESEVRLVKKGIQVLQPFALSTVHSAAVPRPSRAAAQSALFLTAHLHARHLCPPDMIRAAQAALPGLEAILAVPSDGRHPSSSSAAVLSQQPTPRSRTVSPLATSRSRSPATSSPATAVQRGRLATTPTSSAVRSATAGRTVLGTSAASSVLPNAHNGRSRTPPVPMTRNSLSAATTASALKAKALRSGVGEVSPGRGGRTPTARVAGA